MRRELLGFNDRWLMILGIPFVSLILSSVLYSEVLHGGNEYFISKCYPTSIFFTSMFWLLFRELLIQLRKRKAFKNNTLKRVTLEAVLIIPVFIILKPVFTFISFDLLHLDKNVVQPSATLELFSGIIISMLILAIYEIIYIQRQLEKSILEKEQLGRAQIQSQLEGLKNQIQPHFLFNSLNTLAALIPEDSDRAIRYVKKLSEVFRYILEIKNESLIPLGDEIEFLKSYIFLIKERFGENLKVSLEIDPNATQLMVVPLSLQILFENAIKHNVLSREKPLLVRIYLNDKGKLTVQNNLQPKQNIGSTTKIGLDNIKKRYGFIIEDPVDIISSLDSFIVSLPLINPSTIQSKS